MKIKNILAALALLTFSSCNYKEVSIEDLVKNPKRYEGKKIEVTTNICFVSGSKELRFECWKGEPYSLYSLVVYGTAKPSQLTSEIIDQVTDAYVMYDYDKNKDIKTIIKGEFKNKQIEVEHFIINNKVLF
ncbi:MAG: hypothetical protein QW622_02880 [Candidatus Pacearchaeota archaeon]